jgi:hypothetical protein
MSDTLAPYEVFPRPAYRTDVWPLPMLRGGSKWMHVKGLNDLVLTHRSRGFTRHTFMDLAMEVAFERHFSSKVSPKTVEL